MTCLLRTRWNRSLFGACVALGLGLAGVGSANAGAFNQQAGKGQVIVTELAPVV